MTDFDPSPFDSLPQGKPQHYFTARDWLTSVELDRDSETVSLPYRDMRTPSEITLRFATGLGTFSRGELDAGSRLLLATATWPQTATICDLGCGWGAVGCFLARLAPDARIMMCDLSAHAVQLARLNVRTNALPNAEVWQGDGLTACNDSVFDTILCNPPVRAGNEVIANLFREAQRCLRPGGALWVVLRTAQGAKSWQKRLAHQFGNCATVKKDDGFRVLCSIKESGDT